MPLVYIRAQHHIVSSGREVRTVATSYLCCGIRLQRQKADTGVVAFISKTKMRSRKYSGELQRGREEMNAGSFVFAERPETVL